MIQNAKKHGCKVLQGRGLRLESFLKGGENDTYFFRQRPMCQLRIFLHEFCRGGVGILGKVESVYRHLGRVWAWFLLQEAFYAER